MKRFTALFAALASMFIGGARADVQALVNAGKISWVGSPTIIYLKDGAVAESTSYDQIVLKFTDTSATDLALKIADGVKASTRVLVVGGGGAGGTSILTTDGAGGGGGAGGFIDATLSLPGGTYPIKVGAGGAKAASTDLTVGANGQDSKFNDLTSLGGGGGGAASVGSAGGSGGGGSRAGGTSNDGGAASSASPAVGFAGGNGTVVKYGGGGGGAGAVGAKSGSSAKGGNGLPSDITGTELYYAGGGGGGRTTLTAGIAGGNGGGGKGGSTSADALDGENGTGGGGGGSGLTAAGGKGGDGVVIVRVLQAVETKIDPPGYVTLSWTGENQIGYNAQFMYEYVGGTTNATAVGDYSYQVKPAAEFEWFDGSGTEPKTIWWQIEAVKVTLPSLDPIPFDGANHVFVESTAQYQVVDGVASALNAGTYQVTLRLVDKNSSSWPNGSVDDLTLTWKIAPKAVAKPELPSGLVYGGTNVVAFAEGEGYILQAGGVTNSTNAGTFTYTLALDNPAGATNYVWAGESGDAAVANAEVSWTIDPIVVERPMPKTGLVYDGTPKNAFDVIDNTHYDLVDGVITATEGGTYTFTFRLKGNDDAVNYVWNYDDTPSSIDYVGEWKIGGVANAITALSLTGWRVGMTPNTPVISATWGVETVKYFYGFGAKEEDVTEWKDDPAQVNESGAWVLRAVIPESSNWTAATNTTTFMMWNDPGNLYHDQVDIFIAARPGATTTLERFPVLVRVSEEKMQGFLYEREGANGEGMAFIDAEGNLLPYEVDEWNVGAESYVWVRLATLPPEGMTVTMYWNLREGQLALEYTPTAVWEDFTGVWHFGESNGTAFDSTANGLNGEPKGARASYNTGYAYGAVGGARENCMTASNWQNASGNGAYLSVSNRDDKLNLGAVFTISGWVRANNDLTTPVAQYPRLWSRKTSLGEAQGWENEFYGKSTLTQVRASAADNRNVTIPDFNQTWVHFALVFNGSTLEVYGNGALCGTVNVTPVKDEPVIGRPLTFGCNANGQEWFLNGQYDETHYRKGAMTAEWMAAEYATVGDPNFATNSFVRRDGLKVNYWVEEPAMDKETWDVSDDTKGAFTSLGVLANGTVTNYIYSVFNPSQTFADPSEITEAGLYRAVFRPVDNEGYEPLEYDIDIRVVTSKPYTKIQGTNGDSGRILLMNRDTNTKGPVDYQGYKDTKDTLSTFWQHLNEDGTGLPFNLQVGTESMLWTKTYGQRLWHLVDCRHGNTFPAGVASGSLDPLQNYLPYSTTSKSFLSRLSTIKQNLVGQIVMRNCESAAVYSSCFTNGIGTIYFDAVNGWARATEDFECYKLVVEYATNTVQGLPPLDINSFTVNAVDDPETGLTVTTTNWYGNLEGCWHRATVIPFKRDGTAEFVKGEATDELTLDVANAGTVDNFFRVVANLDIHGPVRFRIVRTTYNPNDGIDAKSLILLDNVIASTPAMRADLWSAGHFDPEKSGNQLLGYELASSVPYPSVNDDAIIGRAEPTYYVNSGDGTEPNTADFFSSAQIHYRWRYLNQAKSDWKTIDLNPADGFKALTAFELPDHPCDVEYWYEYGLQAPYYSYVDYTGLDKTIDYTEERGVLTNALKVAGQASCGEDWYFRVRDGKSVYSGIDIAFRRGDSEVVERAHMTLIGDNTWRGFVQTRENQTGKLTWRIEALDRQETTFANYAASTNVLYCATENPMFPISDSLTEGGADNWGTMTLDAVTGYVMFQIDESSRSLTVVHADYQDFNGWSDAWNRKDSSGNGPIFVGTSTTNEYKVGVSPRKQTFEENFSTWQTMPATNIYWQVPTYPDIRHLYGHDAYETFASDTNGLWSIGQGMWVSKRYRHDKDGTGVAIQMEGCGKGYLQFTDLAAAPRGLEKVTFNARLGQFVQFDDFNYYYGSVILNMTNYTFMTRAAFDLNANKDFSGNASLSVVANYLPSKGCYEARYEWVGREINQWVSNRRETRLCLYRWNVTGSGRKTSTLLMAWTNNNFDAYGQTALANNATQKFLPLFITVSNDTANACTWVMAGVRKNGIQLGATPWDTGKDSSAWYGVCYRDNSTSRLTRGTYGCLSANCPGVFAKPQFTHDVLPNTVQTDLAVGRGAYFWDKTINISGLTNVRNCYEDFMDPEFPNWNVIPGRMATHYEDMHVNCIRSAPVAQKLEIYLGTAGRADWGSEPYKTIELASFGSPTTPISLDLYSTKDCSVKFAVAGTIEDVRTDIVIDSLSLVQWRGGDWDDDRTVNGVTQYLPEWADYDHRTSINGFSNYVFSSCWIVDHSVLMSAKRSNLEKPCAIRSPLMDGYIRDGRGGDGTSRGKGLGMISVGYKNAQPNVVLELQIATNNVSTGTLTGYDESFSTNIWTTVTNFTFDTMTASQLKSGTLNCYIGAHDVNGVMRLVMNTNVVLAAQSTTDPSKFGDIYITEIVCRDEPAVDVHSWWGWNMRTVGGDADSEGRMILQDYSTLAGKVGLSAALNNSVANDSSSQIDLKDRESYVQHKPFIQTPTFTSNIVGEVSFKARKYNAYDPDATLVLFGSRDASETDDGTWVKLDGATFAVSNSIYETYSYKTDPGQSYKAFRLAVVGVPGVQEGIAGGGNALPPGVSEPMRVLIDEVFVSEAVRARMGFRNVGCFKSDMAGTTEVPGVPGPGEQPLCNEAWGVQCEIYGAQLPDDIDFSRKPRVMLHWYEGIYPWGYENWLDEKNAKSAWLTQTTDSTDGHYVYRSSQRTCPEAVIPMSTFAPTYVQYTLEVVYYTKGGDTPVTNWMSQADWHNPAWYKPLDLNAQYGSNGGTFAAYNILDTVAPGWAWINEINILGELDEAWNNTDYYQQFIEIAQPPEADISGWKVRLIEADTDSDLVVTNDIAYFGQGDLAGKKDAQWIDPTANMVFRVLSSPQARSKGTLTYADGTLDGVWDFSVPTTYMSQYDNPVESEITSIIPIGIQLVRASGIVEHEVVCIGTNLLASLVYNPEQYEPSNTVNFLNEKMPRTDFIYVGDDAGAADSSRGVYQNRGQETNDWTNLMRKTPGRINQGQYIDPDHPVPSGEDILVYLTVMGDHIQQAMDGSDWTNGMFMVSVRKGSARGTNVTYRVDPWYVLGSLTTNGQNALPQATQVKMTQPFEYVFEEIGKGSSNNVTVIAQAGVNPKLAADYGVDENNPYRPAIIDWLEKGTDLYGNPFYDTESGEIKLAEFRTMNGTFQSYMTLTQMYWLDMDPTVGGLALMGGMATAPSVHQKEAWDGSTLNNLRMTVYMMITNLTEDVADVEHYGKHWTPYALRGLEKQSSSLDYDPAKDDWNSVTFKLTGRLVNGLTRPDNLYNWVPLRWFVFKPDSFDANGHSRIEITDPHSAESIGYQSGWKDWWDEFGPCEPVFYWSIDTRLQPVAIEVLNEENYYGD